MAGALYFTDADGVEYRVLDTRLRNGKTLYADPPAAWAVNRTFRPRDGWWRLYTFAPGEDRTPSKEALRRQLATAGYLAREKFDASSRTPVSGRGAFSEPG